MPYIGRSTDGFGVRNRFLYLASADDTSVSGADANGATLTFTDGAYVDGYLNGVLLKAGTDYNTNTANTIASLSAMSANDEVTVIVYDVFTVGDMVSATSGGTFSGSVTVNGAFTSVGIDDNADATTITIDSNEHVGIGTILPSAQLHIDEADSNSYATIRLEGNNRGGDIEMYQGTVPVSTIRGDQSGNLYFKTSGAYGNSSVSTKLTLETAGDGDVESGDIYFSTAGKGIVLGATSNTDANTLDDYEEGTFTPAADSFSGTMTFTTANYTKVGRIVNFAFKMTSDSTSDSSQISISGFPFAVVDEHPVSLSYNIAGNGAMQSNTTPTIPNAMVNSAEICYFYLPTGGAFQYTFMGAGFIRVAGTYMTTN